MEQPETVTTETFRSYIFFWISQLQSLLGSGIIQFVIIIWITYEYESYFYLGLAAFLGYVPIVIFSPIAGVFVDRWDRKWIIGSVDFVQAIAAFALISLFWLKAADIWAVLALLTIRGCAQAIQMPAVSAIVPLMVPRDRLSQINALNELSNAIMLLLSPVIGAVLLSFWEIQDILWVDVSTFLFAVIVLLAIHIPTLTKRESSLETKQSFRSEFAEGTTFIRKKKGLLSLLATMTIANFFITPILVLYPLFVVEGHGGNETHVALILATFYAGTLTGGLLMASWKGFDRHIVGVVGGIFFMYVGLILVALAPSGAWWLLIMGALIMGVTVPVSNVSSQTIWQKVVLPELLGRVMSVRTTVAWVSIPLSMVLAGVFAELIGVAAVLFTCAVLGLAVLAYSWFMTELPNVESSLASSEVLVSPEHIQQKILMSKSGE
ncbi:MAG: MFS transporter [Candidatus Hodarchaeota archaeon]